MSSRETALTVMGAVGEARAADVPRHRADAAPATVHAARAVTTVGMLQISVLFVTLLRSKVLAMLLHPEGVGIVSTLDQLTQLVAQASTLSLIATPTRFLARSLNDGLEAVTTMYSMLLKLLLISTGIGTAAAIALLMVKPAVLGAGLQSYAGLAIVAILIAPVFALSGFLANVAAAVRGYLTTSVYVLLTAAAALTAAIVGIEAGGIAGLYYANLATGAFGVVAFGLYLRSRVPLKFRPRAARVRDGVRRHPDIIAYCSTTYVLTFAQPLAFLIVRSVLIQRLGSAGAGLFQAVFATSSIASMVLMQAIRVYLEPAVNTATRDQTRIDATNEFQRTFAVIILLGTLPLVLFPYNMLSVLFTSAFTPVSALLFVFVLSDCVFLCGQVYATVVMAVDDFKAYFAANVAGYVCLCLCVWLSIDRFGMAGIAWSFVAARALVFVLIQALLFWRHRLTMTVRAAGVVVYTIVVLAAVASLFGSARVVDVQAVLLRLLAFGVIAVGTLAFLTQAERAWLGAACRRLTEAR